MFLRHSTIYSGNDGEFFCHLPLFSLFFFHGDALYSYLLLIFCFVCSLMGGFHHGLGNDSSPFRDLLHAVSPCWCVFSFFTSFLSLFFHGNALYSYLLLILRFFCIPMVGFHHGLGHVPSPF